MNIEKFEINKPSELCQIVFVQEYKKDYELYKISSVQLDMINALIYKVREHIVKNKIVIDTEIPSTLFEITLKDFTNMFEIYNNNDYSFLLYQLNNLSKVQVIVNALGKNKDAEEVVITRFIHEIRLSKHKHKNDQKIRIAISNVIINKLINIKKYFSKMFFSIQFSMVSKYSKLLYELLKDYEGIRTITIDINELHDLINVLEPSQRLWTSFHNNILKKTIKEINEKSDIFVTYEPIKEKPDNGRLQVTKIKFTMQEQPQSRLQELGLIQESIIDNKYYNKSKSKLDRLVKGGYQVIDEEMWIETDIRKNEDKYEAEIEIDEWLKDTEINARNDFFMKVAKHISDCEDPSVMIVDYKIIGCFSNDTFTKNPLETMTLLNEVIDTNL